MNRPRLYRWLRVAVSAVLLIPSLLLGILWLRSYEKHLHTQGRNAQYRLGDVRGYIDSDKRLYQFRSETGAIILSAVYPEPGKRGGWKSYPIENRAIGFGFESMKMNRFSAVCIPYWFICLAALSLVVTPWLPWQKVRWRFSLRTLLVVTTLIAMVLGLVVWAVR